MKQIYWRPRKVSRILLFLMAVASVSGILLTEKFRIRREQPFNAEKLAAATLAERAFSVIRRERYARGIPLESNFDPARSGLIGPYMSSVTTVPGALLSKQTSVNPNFAAVIVHYLKRLKIKEGDLVAVGYSGSFPALNISVLAALQTLRLRAVIISSVGASGFGANMENLLWVDMERILAERHLWEYRSVAASLGGIGDQVMGMANGGKERIRRGILRNRLNLIETKDFTQGIVQRMEIYKKFAGDVPYKAYINVGGGTLSVGTSTGKALYRPGLNRRPPPGALQVDSVMTRFMKNRVPLIHMVNVPKIAEAHGLPPQPRTPPVPGEGKIFSRREYNRYLALGMLLAIIAGLFLFVRTEWGRRMLPGAGQGGQDLEQSV